MTHEGRRPGDRRVRVERTRPQQFTLKAPARMRRPPPPALREERVAEGDELILIGRDEKLSQLRG